MAAVMVRSLNLDESFMPGFCSRLVTCSNNTGSAGHPINHDMELLYFYEGCVL